MNIDALMGKQGVKHKPKKTKHDYDSLVMDILQGADEGKTMQEILDMEHAIKESIAHV